MSATRVIFSLGVVALAALAPAGARSAGVEDTLAVTRITDGIDVIYGPFDLPTPANRGFRNNPGIVLTSAGVVVIDPGGSVAAGEITLHKVKSITNQPIVAVFDTHIHGDHWLGNAAIKAAFPAVRIYGDPGMKVLAEGAEGARWSKMIDGLTDGANEGLAPVAPDAVVKDGDVIPIGDLHFRIYHPAKAHTETDIMIAVVEKKVLFTGDVVRNGMLGEMQGGSFTGSIQAIDKALETGARYYVPGHGRAGDAEILRAYRDYLSTLYGTVKTLYGDGIADFEMKPRVVQALAAYKDWWGFKEWVGPQVSLAYLEAEANSF